MDFSLIVELFKTPTCFILALTSLVLANGFVLKDLHLSHKDFEINAKTKNKKHKK